MKRFVASILFPLAMVTASCGGGDDGGVDGTNQQLACDIGAGTSSHVCWQWNWNGPVNAADAYSGVCSTGGASTVSSCPASGKIGGCKYTLTSSSDTLTWVNWFYYGTASEQMMTCVGGGQITATWVQP